MLVETRASISFNCSICMLVRWRFARETGTEAMETHGTLLVPINVSKLWLDRERIVRGMTLNNTKRPPDSNTKDGMTNDVWRQDTPSMHFHLGLVNREIFLRATMVKKSKRQSSLKFLYTFTERTHKILRSPACGLASFFKECTTTSVAFLNCSGKLS